MSGDSRSQEEASAASEGSSIPGDRGIPSINRSLSMQARVSHALAIGLMATLGVGVLTWYYTQALSRPARVQRESQKAEQRKAEGDMTLRPLGRVEQPRLAERLEQEPSLAEALLGPEPPLPAPGPEQWEPEEEMGAGYGRGVSGPDAKGLVDQSLKRQLGGDVLQLAGGHGGGAAAEVAEHTYIRSGAGPGPGSGMGASAPGSGSESLGELLRPTVMPASAAAVLPTRRMLLPKGAFLDCTLETAIDSSLPGMTTCVLASDVFGADGTVVLLERGTKLIGETRGRVRNGMSRVFVVWSEARTPNGVVVPLASPGTDALGRAGLEGVVDRHFFERFGAAILISVIDGVIQGAVQSSRNGSTVVMNPSGSQDVLTEVLRQTVDVPPTVRVMQGARIAVLVARDVDFRPVYRLRAVDVHE